MNIRSVRLTKSAMVLYVEGRLNTSTAPLLERKIKQWGDSIIELIIDLSRLTYISSMGLRVLLHAQKERKERDLQLIIQNISPHVKEVFEITGFIKLLVDEERFVTIRKDEDDGVRFCLIGQMDAVHIPMVEQGLIHLRKAKESIGGIVNVILDMEKLSYLSGAGGSLLKSVIHSSAWENRRIFIENASSDVRTVLRKEGLGKLIKDSVAPKAG